MAQVPFYPRNLYPQNSVEGQFAAQVPPLFWNLHRLSRNLHRLSRNLRRLPPNLHRSPPEPAPSHHPFDMFTKSSNFV